MAKTMADNTKYLVNGITEDTEWSKIMTAAEIFDLMDMSDCYQVDIDIWKINGYGEALTECGFIGKWMFKGDPQRMEIRAMDGAIEVGYGTEH